MEIDIAAISLDIENFRHKKASTDREAMQILLADEKTHKVSELAQDIIDLRGLDPSSLLIVTEDTANPGQYIALEGNRRITALKTMVTPSIADKLPTYGVFKKLHPTFISMNLTTVECVVLDRPSASEWIKRKHYKGMGGKGVVEWNAVATARSDASEGRFTRWMTALAFLEENGIDAEELRDRIASKTTTTERVLASPHIASVLGLIFGKAGKLTPENGDIAKACNIVQNLLEAMGEKSFTEPTVSTADQQRQFIERFASFSVKKAAKPNQHTGGAASDARTNSNSSNSGIGNAGQQDSSNAGSQASKSPSSVQRSKLIHLRNKLAKGGLRISNTNLNKFYSELKKLNVETNSFISAAIIRVFLEKSTTVFLEAMQIPPLNPTPGATWRDAKLRSKVEAVLKQIDPKKTDPTLRYAWEVANGVQQKLHSLDELNHAIHDHHALPSPSEIVTTWDRFHPYFLAIFETLEKNGK